MLARYAHCFPFEPKLRSQEISSALRHTRQKAWATDARTRNLQARQTNLHDRLSRLVFQIDQALPPEGSADASTTADIIHKLESAKTELEGSSKSRGKESLRAQVNHLRGRIAELRRFPVRQDNEVGWLAEPEAQAQVGEVRFKYWCQEAGLMIDSSTTYSGIRGINGVTGSDGI
jgi:hypothetical protein